MRWHARAGALDGSQDPGFGMSIGQTVIRQGESRGSKQSERQPKERRELLDASPECQNFLLEFGCCQVRHVEADHDPWYLAKPPTGRRARDAKTCSDRHVSGSLDKISKPVIVAPLSTSGGRHRDDHRRFAY